MIKTTKLINRYLRFYEAEWKAIIIYGLLNTVLLLITPLAVQLVVNQIALSGLKISLVTIIIIISAVLIIAQLVRYFQIVLLEYLQRKIKIWIIQDWAPILKTIHSKTKLYYFEISSVQKKLAAWTLDGFELTLSLSVGLVALTFYHPFFLALSLFTLFSLFIVFRLGKNAVSTSYDESTAKYKIYYHIDEDTNYDDSLNEYFIKRELHFRVVKKQIKFLMISQLIGQVILLVGGVLLVDMNQLSIGQFVAVELIYSTVFYSFTKAPKLLETHYDLVTSLKKINLVLEDHSNE